MEERKARILVVDDSSTMRQLLRMMVAKYFECELDEASDGEEAFEKLGRESFDLVITDVNMPRMDGLDLVRKVRQEAGLDVPMIIVTTKGGEKDRDKGMELGANAYITKPVNGVRLVEAVRELLG